MSSQPFFHENDVWSTGYNDQGSCNINQNRWNRMHGNKAPDGTIYGNCWGNEDQTIAGRCFQKDNMFRSEKKGAVGTCNQRKQTEPPTQYMQFLQTLNKEQKAEIKARAALEGRKYQQVASDIYHQQNGTSKRLKNFKHTPGWNHFHEDELRQPSRASSRATMDLPQAPQMYQSRAMPPQETHRSVENLRRSFEAPSGVSPSGAYPPPARRSLFENTSSAMVPYSRPVTAPYRPALQPDGNQSDDTEMLDELAEPSLEDLPLDFGDDPYPNTRVSAQQQAAMLPAVPLELNPFGYTTKNMNCRKLTGMGYPLLPPDGNATVAQKNAFDAQFDGLNCATKGFYRRDPSLATFEKRKKEKKDRRMGTMLDRADRAANVENRSRDGSRSSSRASSS